MKQIMITGSDGFVGKFLNETITGNNNSLRRRSWTMAQHRHNRPRQHNCNKKSYKPCQRTWNEENNLHVLCVSLRRKAQRLD